MMNKCNVRSLTTGLLRLSQKALSRCVSTKNLIGVARTCVTIVCGMFLLYSFAHAHQVWFLSAPSHHFALEVLYALGTVTVYLGIFSAIRSWFSLVKEHTTKFNNCRTEDNAFEVWLLWFVGSFVALCASVIAIFGASLALPSGPHEHGYVLITILDALMKTSFVVFMGSIATLLMTVAVLGTYRMLQRVCVAGQGE